MAVQARLIQTTWRGLSLVAGSHLSGEGHGYVTEDLGCLNALQEETKIQFNPRAEKIKLNIFVVPFNQYHPPAEPQL